MPGRLTRTSARPDARHEPAERGRSGGTPREGDLIAGKYRVRRLLSVGGMSVVVAARHEQLERAVAIKLMTDEEARKPTSVARFLREARTAAELTSEHVVKVLDSGSLETGVPYLVMELLFGSDLHDVLRSQGPLRVERAVEYLLQACEGIAEPHARGVVHRDLKPSNLFLTQRVDGTPLVKVLDFGISKATNDQTLQAAGTMLTITGAMMGTPFYMSPEQVRNAKNIDQRSDIWSLGAVLHELVSGRRPFEADMAPTLYASIVADPPTPLRSHRSDAPAALEAIILRCLEKDRGRRFQDVAALARALEPFASEVAKPSIARIEQTLGRMSSRRHEPTGDDDARHRPSASPKSISDETTAELPRSSEAHAPAAESLADTHSASAASSLRGSGSPGSTRRALATAVAAAIVAAVAIGLWRSASRRDSNAAAPLVSASPEPSAQALSTDSPPAEPPTQAAPLAASSPAPTASTRAHPTPHAIPGAHRSRPPSVPSRPPNGEEPVPGF